MSEVRLIDANALRKKVCGWFHRDPQEADDQDECAAALCMAIDEAPTVAAEPVRHAYWIDITQEDDDCLWWHCSCCSGVDKGSRKPRYCRACGARMDAKEDAE